MRRLALIIPASASIIMSFSIWSSSPAYACSPTDHCYAQAVMQHTSDSYEGAQATITPHCLYTSDTATGYLVTQEMWLFTDNLAVTPPASWPYPWYWVETGAISDGSDKSLQYRWYWANYWPGTTKIWVHYNGPAVTMDKSYTARIVYTQNNEWAVSVKVGSGSYTQYGTALYNPPYSVEMHAGTEYTAANDRSVGTATNLQYERSLLNTWGSWWGTTKQILGTGSYVTATLPSSTEIDWKSNNC